VSGGCGGDRTTVLGFFFAGFEAAAAAEAPNRSATIANKATGSIRLDMAPSARTPSRRRRILLRHMFDVRTSLRSERKRRAPKCAALQYD
jgi:hypothetical protein